MIKLQKYRAQAQAGKLVDKEEKGSPKMIMDSVADDLLVQGEIKVKSSTNKVFFDIWQEVKEVPVKTERPVKK